MKLLKLPWIITYQFLGCKNKYLHYINVITENWILLENDITIVCDGQQKIVDNNYYHTCTHEICWIWGPYFNARLSIKNTWCHHFFRRKESFITLKCDVTTFQCTVIDINITRYRRLRRNTVVCNKNNHKQIICHNRLPCSDQIQLCRSKPVGPSAFINYYTSCPKLPSSQEHELMHFINRPSTVFPMQGYLVFDGMWGVWIHSPHAYACCNILTNNV